MSLRIFSSFLLFSLFPLYFFFFFFDEHSTLDGACAEFRGKNVSVNAVYNISRFVTKKEISENNYTN